VFLEILHVHEKFAKKKQGAGYKKSKSADAA